MKSVIKTRIACWMILCGISSSVMAGEREEFFESKIRPLLVSRCTECHGAFKREGELQLNHRRAALAGGESGAAIVPGDAQNSLLYQAVSQTHDSLAMPPDDSLSNEEIGNIRAWINQGAIWPISKVEFFQQSIFNTLTKSCVKCHNESERAGGLSLASRERLLQGGQSGAAAVPGHSNSSLLISILSGVQNSPTDHTTLLNKKDLASFEQWINDGLHWQDPNAVPRYVITQEQKDHWSFRPVVRTAQPNSSSSSTNPIDQYIQAPLDRERLKTAPMASARDLARRAYYDLLGLPPTPAQIRDFEEAFAAGGRAAFADLVNRLLDSPHYGERWGRHWLDLVRYADTAGDAADFPVPEAYKYRNYVIDSFNQDKPYNQFIDEQLAGDLLTYSTDEQRWEQIIGTGYIAISRRIGVSPHNLKHITIEDTINNVGTTFLGLTLGCARCHDHKFDPLPTTDYYALYGIFASSVYPHAGAEHKPWRQDFVYRIGQDKAAELLAEKREVLEQWNRKERVALEIYRDFQRKKITEPGKTRQSTWANVLEVREQRRQHAETFPELEIAYAIQEGTPHDEFVQRGGSPAANARGQLVPRGFLQILGGQTLSSDNKSSGRLELAQWISSKNNPLTARVMANRIWHYHFGKGIVTSTSDFGFRGATPTHPELLDYLALELIEQGWSIKQLHRLIMVSDVYMRSTEEVAKSLAKDPDNKNYWRFDRQRMDAEQIRDTLLTLSNELIKGPGG
ncbi:MAG: PSD1 and planctomycete cytochrome C domain-containing protein, partial [Planctomycetota bacterium]|nr:PSD1 and planctomycete cytochrome C domain-containing protein [Planctomycetota bacterium]